MMKIIAVSILFILIYSCNSEISLPVLGKYKANHNRAKEYLVLKEDSTYIHIINNDEIDFSEEGKWKLIRENNKNTKIILLGFTEKIQAYDGHDINPYIESDHLYILKNDRLISGISYTDFIYLEN